MTEHKTTLKDRILNPSPKGDILVWKFGLSPNGTFVWVQLRVTPAVRRSTHLPCPECQSVYPVGYSHVAQARVVSITDEKGNKYNRAIVDENLYVCAGKMVVVDRDRHYVPHCPGDAAESLFGIIVQKFKKDCHMPNNVPEHWKTHFLRLHLEWKKEKPLEVERKAKKEAEREARWQAQAHARQVELDQYWREREKQADERRLLDERDRFEHEQRAKLEHERQMKEYNFRRQSLIDAWETYRSQQLRDEKTSTMPNEKEKDGQTFWKAGCVWLNDIHTLFEFVYIRLFVPNGAMIVTQNPCDKHPDCDLMRKSRVSYARVVSITGEDGCDYKEAFGWYRSSFKYVVGEVMVPDQFDDDPSICCGHGIHVHQHKIDCLAHKRLFLDLQKLRKSMN